MMMHFKGKCHLRGIGYTSPGGVRGKKNWQQEKYCLVLTTQTVQIGFHRHHHQSSSTPHHHNLDYHNIHHHNHHHNKHHHHNHHHHNHHCHKHHHHHYHRNDATARLVCQSARWDNEGMSLGWANLLNCRSVPYCTLVLLHRSAQYALHTEQSYPNALWCTFHTALDGSCLAIHRVHSYIRLQSRRLGVFPLHHSTDQFMFALWLLLIFWCRCFEMYVEIGHRL